VKKPADGWDAEEQDLLRAMQPELEQMQARHASDPPLEALRAGRAGVLPDDEQAAIQARLDRSEWDRALVDGANDVEDLLSVEDRSRLLGRIRSRRSEPELRARGGGWMPAVAAAALVILVGGAMLFRRGADSTATPDSPVAVVTPPSSGPPSYVLALDPPLLKVSPRSLTYRGTGGGTDVLTDLKPAFDALRARDYAKAGRDLVPLAARYPESVEVTYYQGIAHLFMNDPAAALESLARAERVADESFAADIAWYQAVASERLGRRDAARAHLDQLCSRKGPRSAEACVARPKLQQP
jgi:tetratricopeptide (TPR) repeat protein